MGKKQNSVLQGARILVAEDSRINQIVIQTMLEHAGMIPQIANNGVEALKEVQISDFDLILMDVQMPEMDGYETAAAIREFENRKSSPEDSGARHRTPIIAMTAHVMPEDRQKCLDAGMDDCLGKPVEPEQMLAFVKNYIKRENRELRDAESLLPQNIPAEQALTNPQPDPPVLDSAAGIRRVGGNAALYRKLLTAFSEDYAAAADFVRENLKKGNTEQAGQMVHSIRGAAGNMGAEVLYRAAAELEACIREHPDRPMREIPVYTLILSRFESALHQIRESAGHMKIVPDDKTAPVNEKNGSPQEQASELKNLLSRLSEFIKDGDSESAEIIKKIRPHLSMPRMEELIFRIDAHLFDFDFEKAGEILEIMMKMLDGD